MIDALRLTREGRLAEATALMQRAFGGGHAPGGMRTHVDVPPLQPEPESGTEPPKLELLETGEATPNEPTIPPRISVPPTPGRLFTLPKLKSMGGLDQDLLEKPGAHGPAPRQFPTEMVAPAAGRWVSGTYAPDRLARAPTSFTFPADTRGSLCRCS